MSDMSITVIYYGMSLTVLYKYMDFFFQSLSKKSTRVICLNNFFFYL